MAGASTVGVAVIAGGRVGLCIDGSISHAAQPIVPSDIASVDQDCLVVAVVANVFEEDAAAERRDLQAGDVDVGVEVAPGVGANGVGDEGGQQAVEIEEEEDRQDAADEQLNEEDPIEAIARVQRLCDDSAGHGWSALRSVGSGSLWCSSAHRVVAVAVVVSPRGRRGAEAVRGGGSDGRWRETGAAGAACVVVGAGFRASGLQGGGRAGAGAGARTSR